MSNHISDLQALKAFNIVGNLGHCLKVIEVIWSLFPMCWVKINNDGTTRVSQWHASIGEIFRNHDGDMFGGFCSYTSIQYSLLAELVAAMRKIEIAKGKKLKFCLARM